MYRANKKYGRCPVAGHGQDCCISEEIQSNYIPRSVEKHKMKQEAIRELDDYLNNADDLPWFLKEQAS